MATGVPSIIQKALDDECGRLPQPDKKLSDEARLSARVLLMKQGRLGQWASRHDDFIASFATAAAVRSDEEPRQVWEECQYRMAESMAGELPLDREEVFELFDDPPKSVPPGVEFGEVDEYPQDDFVCGDPCKDVDPDGLISALEYRGQTRVDPSAVASASTMALCIGLESLHLTDVLRWVLHSGRVCEEQDAETVQKTVLAMEGAIRPWQIEGGRYQFIDSTARQAIQDPLSRLVQIGATKAQGHSAVARLLLNAICNNDSGSVRLATRRYAAANAAVFRVLDEEGIVKSFDPGCATCSNYTVIEAYFRERGSQIDVGGTVQAAAATARVVEFAPKLDRPHVRKRTLKRFRWYARRAQPLLATSPAPSLQLVANDGRSDNRAQYEQNERSIIDREPSRQVSHGAVGPAAQRVVVTGKAG